jgi:RNA polymerase sigma factor for flagellar operon FliA
MDLYTGYAEIAEVAGAAQAPQRARAFSAAEEQRHLLAHAPLVKRVVRQLGAQVGGAIDRDDMEQIGLMGLLEALRRYGEPDEQFAGFAMLRIRGAILDELRRQDWRPRSVRQQSHKLRDGLRELTRKLGREPSEAEAIAALGVTAEAFQAYLLDESAEELASFDELLAEMHDVPSDVQSPEAQLMTRRTLEKALLALDEREQRVVQMVYEFELSYKEIAAVLGLTDARICQINKQALRKMKTFLQAA